MAEFLIESPHTSQECMQVIDDTLSKGSNVLSKFEWGCMSGEHTGWALVKAKSESDAKKLVPSRVRGKTRVVKVSKISPKQIREYHEKM
jgi:hypothetical protein